MMRVVFVFLLLAACMPAMSGDVQPVIWNLRPLDGLSDSADGSSFLNALIKSADRYTRIPSMTIVSKSRTISGNPHNFESLSIYFWPDPNNPSGPYIVRDGHFNPEYKDYDLPKLIEFRNRLKTLALAYYVTRDSIYSRQCVKDLETWFLNAETRMLPNFEYAQCAPGHWNNKGAAVGLVDAYYFVDILETIRLLQQNGALTEPTLNGLQSWFSAFLDWALHSDNGRRISAMADNVSTAYDVLILSMSVFVNRDDVVDAVKSRFAKAHIVGKIDSKGRQTLELKRANAMTYSLLNLSFMLDYYTILDNLGMEYSKTEWKYINNAVKYLCRFVNKRHKFKYSELSDWKAQETNIYLRMMRFNRLKLTVKPLKIDMPAPAYSVTNVTN